MPATSRPLLLIHAIPNWGDNAGIQPIKQNNPWREEQRMTDKIVVMYSGNLGLSQDLSIVFDAASQLKDQEDLLFLLIGEGASKPQLQQHAETRRLTNVRILPSQPRGRLGESLSAVGLPLLPIRAEALKSLTLGKLCGISATGTPVVSAAPPGSEVGRIIEQAGAGIYVHLCASFNLAGTIREQLKDPDQLRKMGKPGRQFAVANYDRKICVQKFANLIQNLCSHHFPVGSRRGCSSSRCESPDNDRNASTCCLARSFRLK